ncbi:MAG: transcriptional repressor [bacterium]|nr:transcriptional repressor [bacterium]
MEYKELLKKNKLKITPKRMAIINYFLQNNKYFTPYDVWTHLKKKFIKLGLPTIYRNLEEFERIGILTKVEGKENRYYYGICKMKKGKHHHHIICTLCHEIKDFDICDFDKLKEQIEAKTGFEITEHRFFLKGVCKNCKKMEV